MSEADRLSRIETSWSIVVRAHRDDSDERLAAQQTLIERYGFAIRRYLQAELRSDAAVDEVFQEFALAFVRGDYHRAHPDRGKFRSFLKTILFRLVADYRRTLYRRESPAMIEQHVDAVALDDDARQIAELDREFITVWRESLLAQTWARLERIEVETGKPLFTVLRCRTDHPEINSTQLARKLSEKLGKPVTATNTRVLILRARVRFANLLVDEILPSLPDPTLDRLEEELIELGLIEYCRNVLDQRRRENAQ